MKGRTEPRLWTPPLRELTPRTSYGFDLIDFARDVVGEPFDPWQKWLAIHAGELLPDGRPRFRIVLALVARQQGKTTFSRVLTLYWMFVDRVPLVLGTSTNLDYARESWRAVCDMAQRNDFMVAEMPAKSAYTAIGREELINNHGSRYKFAASNRRTGRSLTVHRLILDEIREHDDWETWNAAFNAMNAVDDAQCLAISNQGDDTSVVLDSLRESAVDYIETGVGDHSLGLFEWSCPPGSDPTDLDALAYANPDLGNRTHPDVLLASAMRAKKAGGVELAGFRTEVMCMRVHLLDAAIDHDLWETSGTSTPTDLAEHREKVALCLDVSLDGSHASLIAAAVIDGKAHIDVVKAWDGHSCTRELRAELPEIVDKVKPRAVGWLPNGPAASISAEMVAKKVRNWPPKRVELVELSGDVPAVCMGLAEQVTANQVVHSNDPLLTAQVHAATKSRRGDSWVFARRGAGPVDAVYAAAGAVHLARTLPPARAKLVVLP